MKQIPNLFTLLNLFSGCLAIVLILQYNPGSGLNLSGIALLLGSLCIFVSAVIDFLDGFVARLFNASSEMGAQLDSLADVVSFGVAPAMILYKLLEGAVEQYPALSAQSMWFLLPAFILPCAGAWRLARFNLDKEQAYYFKGLPIPAAGITIASLPLIRTGAFDAGQMLNNPWVLYFIILLFSWLMVSKMPLISLKFKSRGVRENADKIILLAVGVISAIFLMWAAIPLVMIAYVIVSLFFRPDQK